MEQQLNFEHRLTETEQRSKSNTHRIEEVEKRQSDLEKLTSSVAELSSNQRHMEGDVKEIKADVKSLTSKPAKRWDAIMDKIIWAILAAVIAFFLGRLGDVQPLPGRKLSSGISHLLLRKMDVAHRTIKITPGSQFKIACNGQAQPSALAVQIGGQIRLCIRLFHWPTSFSAFSSASTAVSSGLQGIWNTGIVSATRRTDSDTEAISSRSHVLMLQPSQIRANAS